jgi:hypothetical protein
MFLEMAQVMTLKYIREGWRITLAVNLVLLKSSRELKQLLEAKFKLCGKLK